MAHEWYIQHGGKQHGPITSASLKKLAAERKITPSTQVRLGTSGNWVPAARVQGLFGQTAAAPSAKTPPVPAKTPPPTPPRAPAPAPDLLDSLSPLDSLAQVDAPAAPPLANLAGLFVVLTCVPLFAAILRVPFSIIAPIILVICAVGAYTVHNSLFDVWLMLVFGIAGYALGKLGYPLAPLVLAIVLGDKAEESFRQAMLLSQGDVRIFFSNWLVSTIMGLGVFMLILPAFSWARGLLAGKERGVSTA